MIYDVLIVGAGPAGAYLAYLLAKENLKVIIIDKAEFPRDKVCGGGISQKTIDILDFGIEPIIQKKIVGAFLSYQNKNIIERSLDERSGLTVVRSEFDNFILNKAVEKGVNFVGHCSYIGVERKMNILEISTSRGFYKAKYLVGADGVFSKVRNTLFGRGVVTYAPAMEALIYVHENIIDRYANKTLLDFGGMPKGYGWIFPKKNHLNVGVFSIFGSKQIKQDLDNFISMYPSLHSYKKIEYYGYCIPTNNPRKKFGGKNIILIGDAAGFAESFYGEGIYFALKSAKIAAKALRDNFDNNNCYLSYKTLVKSQLSNDLFYSRLNGKLFFQFQKFGYYAMVRNKFVNQFFAELIGGEVGHKECFYKTLFTLPYWLFSAKYPDIEGLKV